MLCIVVATGVSLGQTRRGVSRAVQWPAAGGGQSAVARPHGRWSISFSLVGVPVERREMEINWNKLAEEIRQKIKSYTQLVDGWQVCKKSVSKHTVSDFQQLR